MATADLKQSPDQPEGAPQGANIGVGSEVPGAANVTAPGDQYPGERFRQGDGDGGVALVVLEADVESRLVFLDEVVFEEERLCFALDHDGVDIGDVLPQEEVLGGVVAGGEVTLGPRAQALGLTHIDDRILKILPQIHAWDIGEVVEFALQLVGHCRRPP